MCTDESRTHILSARNTVDTVMAVCADATDIQELQNPVNGGFVDILLDGMAVG